MDGLIRSGSHVPGVTPEAFQLPAGTALRYERPASALARFLPSYAVFDSDVSLIDPGMAHWMLPGWARIWIRLTAGPISVAIGNRRYDPLTASAMYGVTSRAMPVVTQGGITVGIDVSPLGWARFVATAADTVCDRIVPLQDLLPATFVHDLAARLHASDRDIEVKGIIDDAFTRHLPPPNPAEPLIEKMAAAFADRGVQDIAAAAARVGVAPPTLQRLCRRYFGFSPKLLMMRARFMRVITDMLVADGPIDHSATPPDYHNVPHLLRDANRFLGMTPRRFVAMDLPYLRASLRARRLVVAAPTPSLDPPPAS